MADDPQPPPAAPGGRSLDALAAVLRVIRIPRDDVRAMLGQVGGDAATILQAVASPAVLPEPDEAAIAALPHRIRSIYARAGSPRAAAIGAGRGALLDEVLANRRDGRLASTVALAITQIDGLAADVPPVPDAAFPFVVADDRDRATPDPLLTAAVVAAHPGTHERIATLMRTARPDSGPTEAVHRHGIMHGRDLGFGTATHAAQVLGVLEALVDWAEPVVAARVAAGRVRR